MASKMATNGHVIFLSLLVQRKVLLTFCESFNGFEILCVEPVYPQYSGVFETCLALRYWYFEVLGSESVKSFVKIEFSYVFTINMISTAENCMEK